VLRTSGRIRTAREYDPKYEKWQFDDLPILPEAWKLKVSKDKKKQFDVLKGLMNRSDVEYLVNGCDAGREGELIFQRVYMTLPDAGNQ
jgi:topB: DNA topoisomerase III